MPSFWNLTNTTSLSGNAVICIQLVMVLRSGALGMTLSEMNLKVVKINRPVHDAQSKPVGRDKTCTASTSKGNAL